ncbi:MAG: hypothetical protein HY299_12490 [Verrucomicrobia bacterium]|nr:hypothetical protein [Verrucomicrobiota bacterium]
MNDPKGPVNDPPAAAGPGTKSEPIAGTPPPPAGSPVAAAALTPEEQMERFADDLKENDWGHQPC